MGRTDTLEIKADTMLDVKSMYELFSEAKITTIKEIVYNNPTPTPSNVLFYRELKVLVGSSSKSLSRFFVVRFVKPSLTKEAVIRACKAFLLIDTNKVDKVHNIVKHG